MKFAVRGSEMSSWGGVRAGGLLYIFFAIAFAGCTSATDPPAATITGEKLTGTVAAFASGAPVSVSPVGVLVGIQGTPFQATTDTGGHFEIDNIPAGVYNIIFSKPGFDSMVYPVHHLIGAGNDIINDAFVIQESNDSISISGVSSVFTVSTTKTVRVIDTIFHDSAGIRKDTVVLQHDSIVITYDTVQNADALIVTGRLAGNLVPANVYVYSSLDSLLFPSAAASGGAGYSEDAWLAMHVNDPTYHGAFQSPRIVGGVFKDTLSADIEGLKPYSLGAGEAVFIYVVGHSNTTGLPETNGEYQHYYTTPYGPQVVRFRFVVP